MSDNQCFSRAFPASEGDRVMISGVSGRFPNSDTVADFEKNLFNKVDMTDEDERRWKHVYPEIPRNGGKINHLEKFDAPFFGVHYKQAHTMDPQQRLLVERAYEAILDAGMNPKDLRGTRTGVFVGCCFAESEKYWFYEKVSTGGLGLMGCARALISNRISYSLGLQGPSLLADTACSSSLTALDLAFNAIRNGECDAAIVGGVNLTLNPLVTYQFARLGVLATGKCKPFDDSSDGYVRSEAASCIFLQRFKDCKRAYCEIVYTKANCDGFKGEGITYPSGAVQKKLMTEFYDDINLPPSTVGFVEAHSTGTRVGDPEECEAIDSVFCKGRTEPLLVGSVKSNMGHSESASGLCSMVKSVLAFHRQSIPPNINFDVQRKDVLSIVEGRLRVVQEVTPLPNPYIAINSFGFGGANVHCLLKDFDKPKINGGRPRDSMPRLVTWSGRTEDAVNKILDTVAENPIIDEEFLSLLRSIQSQTISPNIFRGYGVFEMENDATVCSFREVQHFPGAKRAIVWVFSGMGSQWTEMGAALMRIPRFRESIEKSAGVLAPFGLHLEDILTNPENKYENILHSFVGIAAVQIALVDILRDLGIPMDYVIGHSVGELGCAYADGCFTAEQMILAAYCRGKVSLETKKIYGSMAAVGLGYQQLKSRLPNTIEVACHNGPDSCTISGPAAEVSSFVATLKSEGVFAKEVPCSNIAYHSRYIADMGPNLEKMLQEIIPTPKKRSEKWLSTSVPKHRWDEPNAKLSSARYHTNNLLNAVLFEETSVLLPSNCMTIEVAPHGLLQAILKKSLPNALHFGLTQRGNKDNAKFLLQSLGKLFMNGIDIPIEKLYPKVDFPVSRGTRMISPLIKWDHSSDWFVCRFEQTVQLKSSERVVSVNNMQDEFDYVQGHMIDGRVVFPATAYLFMVWETFGMMLNQAYVEQHIEFSDVRFQRATYMSRDKDIDFLVVIHLGTGRFEISEGKTPVVTGVVRTVEGNEALVDIPAPTSNCITLESKDFYKELRLRGYHYGGEFRGVLSARSDGLSGRINHNPNWVPFLDNLMQVYILGQDLRSLVLPTRIERMRIDCPRHVKMTPNEDPQFDVFISKELNTIRCGGVEIVGLHASPVSRRRPPGSPVLESYEFVPHLPAPLTRLRDACRVAVQLALENDWTHKVKAVEVDTIGNKPLISLMQEALIDLPLITPNLMYLTSRDTEITDVHVENGKLSSQTDCMFVIATNCLQDPEFPKKAMSSLSRNGYLISRETDVNLNTLMVPVGLQLILVIPTEEDTLVMLQRVRNKVSGSQNLVRVSSEDVNFNWLEELKGAIKQGPVTVLAERDTYSGILGLVNCIRREPGGNLITCVFIDDINAPSFTFEDPMYKAHLSLGLAVNVFRDGAWGSYRHLLLSPEPVVQRTSGHVYANIMVRGDLSSFAWFNGPLSSGFFREQGVVQVAYCSLNFRDVMVATGKLPIETIGASRMEQECVLGLEYSGYTSQGKRIMGMINTGALSSQVVDFHNINRAFDVPDSWTMEDAATVPVVYLTVYIAYFFTANIQKGKKILIHAGTGGVGLAAIRTALAYGLDVFTTVSTDEKKAFLLKTFPELKDCQIGRSRDATFEQMVKLQTKGRGVDYVLNSLAGELLQASIRCVAKSGHFLEIGKFDLSNNTPIGLGHFLKQISFHSVLADDLFSEQSEVTDQIMAKVQRDINRGIIQPLPVNVFDAAKIEDAFRFLASGKHIGKVIIKIREQDGDELTMPIPIRPRFNCNSEMSSYVIPGGLGGFGLELADWLVIRGARKIVLSSSRGITKSYQAYRIRLWKSYGAEVLVNTSDITTLAGCEELLEHANKMGPVAGIFNLAVVLRDNIIENQTGQKFAESMAPKSEATKFLDTASRKLCPYLQHFVVFSSVSCGRGNAGQSNYGMTNSIMERIVEQRVRDGLPGKAIQWGAVGEVGLVADMKEDRLDMEIGGTLQQRISSCLQELDPLLMTPNPVVASMVVAEKRLGSGGKLDVQGTVMHIMGIRDMKSVSLGVSLSELGMDSLMAVEIKQTLERDFDIILSPQDLRSLTFQKLIDLSQQSETENVKLNLATEQPRGMDLLVRNLGSEADSLHSILKLKNQSKVTEDNVCAIIVPGIEGVAGTSWESVAMELKLCTYIVQLTNTIGSKSVTEITEKIIDSVREIVKGKEYFYIIGYSFGAVIAIDIVQRLESLGLRGKLVLIDGAPLFLKRLANEQLPPNYTLEFIQYMIIASAMRLVVPPEDSLDVMVAIKSAKGWEERVEKALEMSHRQNVYSKDYLRLALNALYERTLIVMNWVENTDHQLRSPIVLLRPADVSVVDIDEDYGLKQQTKGSVTVKFIEGNHTTMLNNKELSRIINELSPAMDEVQDFSAYIKMD